MEKLDIDGMHRLIVILQRSYHRLATIRLSNLGCVKYNFPHHYKKTPDEWWKISTGAFNRSINHQTPCIPISSDWIQKDPTFIMLKSMILAGMTY